MAKIQRYNPPPNWPPPPPGWAPPAGWQPDPSWGPPPQGWPLWTAERANPRAWGYAYAFAGGYWVLSLALGLLITRGSLDPAEVGRTLAQYGVAGLIVALIGWNISRRWPWWLYALLVLGAVFLLGVIIQTGQRAGG